MPALTMLRLLLAILFKNHDKLPPLTYKIGLNGYRAEERTDLLFFVTSLERSVYGDATITGGKRGVRCTSLP